MIAQVYALANANNTSSKLSHVTGSSGIDDNTDGLIVLVYAGGCARMDPHLYLN